MQRLFERYGLEKAVEQQYPFELSGGMARRVLLMTALMSEPKLIIADEPTTGMDFSLAAKAMEDFRSFADEGNGVLLITHDLKLALTVQTGCLCFMRGQRSRQRGQRILRMRVCSAIPIQGRFIVRCRSMGLRRCPARSRMPGI